MSEAGLDQLVKGSPPPNVSLPSVAAAAASTNELGRPGSHLPSPAPSDPTSLLPSSPPQIYLNLLILEASLRAQYLTLRARRRQHTFILTVLLIWIAYFFYGQFLRPREDGTGMGGSVYWLVDMLEKIALIGGLVMGVLFRLTGQWERGVRWPSKWLRTTNRGLRGYNCKIVVLKGPWWRELVSHFVFLFPVGWFVETPGSNYHYIEYSTANAGHERRLSQTAAKLRREKHHLHEMAEEDIAPGGDYIKILLLPKHFTPDFRENWEMYRAEYWETENHRRAELRAKIRAQVRAEAKAHSPWLWWLPFRGYTNGGTHSAPMRVAITRLPSDGSNPPSRMGSQRQHQHAKRGSIVKTERPASVIVGEGRDTHSRSSSRSSSTFTGQTPNPDTGVFEDPRERRASTSDPQRRRKKAGTSAQELEKRSSIVGVTGRTKVPASSSRPLTPTDAGILDGATLRSKSSNLALSSGSDGDSPARRRTVDHLTKVKVKMEDLD